MKQVTKYKVNASLLLLLSALGAVKGFADPTMADVIDKDEDGKYVKYYIDTNKDGLEDHTIIFNTNMASSLLLKRYIQPNGKLVYEDRYAKGSLIEEGGVLAVILPDGRILKMIDLFPNYYRQFPSAFDPQTNSKLDVLLTNYQAQESRNQGQPQSDDADHIRELEAELERLRARQR
jgi:hypothetical protein